MFFFFSKWPTTTLQVQMVMGVALIAWTTLVLPAIGKRCGVTRMYQSFSGIYVPVCLLTPYIHALLYDRYGSAVLARWERAYLKRLEQAVATGSIVMKERDLPSWKDQPSFWMVLNESLKSGLAFGLLDTRWDMRHALCTFENGTLHRISDRPPTGCRMARPFILHEAHSSDRDRVSRHTATGVRLMS